MTCRGPFQVLRPELSLATQQNGDWQAFQHLASRQAFKDAWNTGLRTWRNWMELEIGITKQGWTTYFHRFLSLRTVYIIALGMMWFLGGMKCDWCDLVSRWRVVWDEVDETWVDWRLHVCIQGRTEASGDDYGMCWYQKPLILYNKYWEYVLISWFLANS